MVVHNNIKVKRGGATHPPFIFLVCNCHFADDGRIQGDLVRNSIWSRCGCAILFAQGTGALVMQNAHMRIFVKMRSKCALSDKCASSQPFSLYVSIII